MPALSMAGLAWVAGISARSSTWSTRSFPGAMTSPSYRLTVKFPSGCADARPGGDQHERAGRHQDGRTGRERAAAHGHLPGEPGPEAARGDGAHFAPPSAVSVFSASFAPTGEKPGLSFRAADRLLRASFLLPVACSIMPRW